MYATALGWPGQKGSTIKSLANTSPYLAGKKTTDVSLMGYNGKLTWEQTAEGLKIQMPAQKPNRIAVVFKIDGIV